MPTDILAIGTSTTPSGDVTIAAGAQLTVSMKGDPATPAVIDIQLKDDAGAYWSRDYLDSRHRQGLIMVAAGTWRFVRRAGGGSCGVFSG